MMSMGNLLSNEIVIKQQIEDTKTCPKCNAENPIGANFCRKCRYEFPEETKDGRSLRPVIKSLSIDEDKYVIGSVIHLRWIVENATNVMLADTDVTVYDECELVVEKATKIQLVAQNDYDQSSKSVSIKPSPLPLFRKFRSNLSNVRSGQPVKLSWHIEHSSKIEISTNDCVWRVRPIDSIEVQLSETQDVCLRAYSYDPDVYEERICHIEVLSEVEIISAGSGSRYIVESNPVKLRWDIRNADSIILYPQNIDVSGQSEIEVFPRRTTTYHLIASNRISQKEVLISVGVQPLPQVDAKLLADIEGLRLPGISLAGLPTDSSMGKISEWMLSSPGHKIGTWLLKDSIFKKVKSLLNLK